MARAHFHLDPADAGMPAGPGTAPPPPAPDFAVLGTTFNDATRALVGGLWQSAVEEGGQSHGSMLRYVADLQIVSQGLQAEINAGQFSGATLDNVQTILSDLATAIRAATASVNGGGTFGSVAAAETTLHDSHLAILNLVNEDANLAELATANGANGFLAAPPALDDGVIAATVPQVNLAEIGAIFNDAANHILEHVRG